MVGLGGNERIIMIPTPGAPNGGNGQPSPDDNQVNPSSLMLTGLKKSIQKAKGKGVEKQSRGRLTGESSNLGVENSEDLFRVKPQTLVCSIIFLKFSYISINFEESDSKPVFKHVSNTDTSSKMKSSSDIDFGMIRP